MVEYTLDTTEKEYWEQKSCVQDYDDKGLWDIIEEYGFELNGDSNFSYFNDYAEHNFNEDELRIEENTYNNEISKDGTYSLALSVWKNNLSQKDFSLFKQKNK